MNNKVRCAGIVVVGIALFPFWIVASIILGRDVFDKPIKQGTKEPRMNKFQLWYLRHLVRKAMQLNRPHLITNMMVEEHKKYWTEDTYADIQGNMESAVRVSMLKLKDESKIKQGTKEKKA